jgi:hypothetical protein
VLCALLRGDRMFTARHVHRSRLTSSLKGRHEVLKPRISLAALPPGMTVHLDGTPTGATVEVPAGRHHITPGSRTDER